MSNISFRKHISLSFLYILMILFTSSIQAQVAPLPSAPTGSKINYIRTINVSVPEKNPNVVMQKTNIVGEVQMDIQYLDGLGRQVQSTSRYASFVDGDNPWLKLKDIITINRYDFDASQQSLIKSQNYLPFVYVSADGFYGNGFQLQQSFWLAKHPDEQFYYSENRSERSPLGRIEKTLGPGDGWVGTNNGMSSLYEYNTSAENIIKWTIDFPTGSVPIFQPPYSAGKLTKSITINEKGKKTYTYRNFEGQIILRKVQDKETGAGLDENSHDGWLCTYYVYDDLGHLRSIITPKAFKYLQANGMIFANNDAYQELCTWYEYDERDRVIIKHAPGAGQIQMVYDNKDRLVLSQDENQRHRGVKQWSFYLYDNLDRPIATGLFDKDATRDAMATFVNTLNNGNVSISIFTGTSENIKADNPVIGSSSYCNSCSNTVINTVNYYDEYSYQGAKPFNTDFTFAPVETTYGQPDYNPHVEPVVTSPRTIDLPTGTKTRVINDNYDDGNALNDQFLTSTYHYDDKGRNIQTSSDNVKAAADFKTNQYDFSGRLVGTCEKHTMPGTSINNFAIVTKFHFDRIRRCNAISKKIGSEAYKKIVSYRYDEFGAITTKKLSPDYNSGAGIETLEYEYNIRRWLNGINKEYALSTSSLSQWDHYFGMYIGYDNRDSRFVAGQYNGNITGNIWKTQGDNMPRKYNYEYDNIDRFTKALFAQKERPSETNWASNKMDFSVTDLSYDENGNIKSMYQKGIIPGNNSPIFIDKLLYDYKTVAGNQWSNQLKKVFDDQPGLTASNNGSLGDFKDETFGNNSDDYVYDYNGNLIQDNNKKIRVGSSSGVIYNFFDKPQKVTLENKAVINFVYDATGAKLAKKVTNSITGISKTTWYMGAFIYEETGGQTNLQMILHEEGRIRVYSPINNPRIAVAGNFDLPDNKKGTYEFFIKDNLQNTRAILSEETRSEFNNCTSEDTNPNNSFYEDRMFGQVDASGNPVVGSNEVSSTRVNKTDAPGWSSNSSDRISKLGYFGKKLGPNMILKVMAGDNIAAKTDYYYNGAIDNSGTNNILSNILSSFVSSLSYNATTVTLHGTSTAITSNINSSPGDLGAFLSNQNTGVNTTPQAYMNILFFDENFNFVPYDNVTGLGSYAWRVTNSGDGQSIPQQISKAPKNGYAFVYLSNESKTYVYFDNFEVIHSRGRLIEENVYYPYGLKVSGISAKVFDAVENSSNYQGDFNDFEDETDWNDFELRSFDGQIGRFLQNDPYNQYATPYTGMGNDPVNYIDQDGGWSWGLTGAVLGAVGGGIAGYNLSKGSDNKSNRFWGTVAGALVGAGVGYATFESLANRWGGEDMGSAPLDGIQRNGSTKFWANFVQFYSGLIGYSSQSSTYIDKNGWSFAQTPDLGTGWYEGFKLMKEFKNDYFATSGVAQRGDVVLSSRTIAEKDISGEGAGEGDRFVKRGTANTIVDEGTYTIPAGFKYNGFNILNSWSDVDPLVNPWGFNPKRINVSGGKITITQPAVDASLYRTSTDRTYDGSSMKSETRLKLKYYREVERNIKTFRLFGIPIKIKLRK